MNASNISEIDALKIIDDTLSKVADQDGKKRIIDWIISKHFKESTETFFESTKKPNKKTVVKKGQKRSSSGKPSYSIVKDLILKPKGKKSFRDFASEKKPANHKEKCVVCIYYLIKILEISNIDINFIYTCYKDVNWKGPKDLKNMLHQAGTEGWLDTKDGNNLLVTPIGEDLVEHDLPHKEKKK